MKPTCDHAQPCMPCRVFCGVYPTGYVFADRQREQRGDYKRLAYFNYDSLTLTIEKDCPDELRNYICEATAGYRPGQVIELSASGQTYRIGSKFLRRTFSSQFNGRRFEVVSTSPSGYLVEFADGTRIEALQEEVYTR